MVQNFPGQFPTAPPVVKYPVTDLPQAVTLPASPLPVTEVGGVSAAQLGYMLTAQQELLTELLIQMKIANYYLQSLTIVSDEPNDIRDELLNGREH